ncbi:hypothetical protein CPB84DRAFT_1781311 [Gymnopilus junonius]|uniref:Uncharacterized protein n=1 Tax=Gymnopilus junonius TaxID=109634 RepID=A0A9P5TN19_GYMJU|nr:hypothetical protein CPB84DRAFT_1781311 [Gymnopilus junonius]
MHAFDVLLRSSISLCYLLAIFSSAVRSTPPRWCVHIPLECSLLLYVNWTGNIILWGKIRMCMISVMKLSSY